MLAGSAKIISYKNQIANITSIELTLNQKLTRGCLRQMRAADAERVPKIPSSSPTIESY